MLSNPVALGAVARGRARRRARARGSGASCGRAALLRAAAGARRSRSINALVTRDGLTVIVRLGDLPLLGHTDVTLEATVYGASSACGRWP